MKKPITDWVCSCNTTLPLTVRYCPKCHKQMPEDVCKKIFREVLSDEIRIRRKASILKHNQKWASAQPNFEKFKVPATLIIIVLIIVAVAVTLILHNQYTLLWIVRELWDFASTLFKRLYDPIAALIKHFINKMEPIFTRETLDTIIQPLKELLSFIFLFLYQLIQKIIRIFGFTLNLFT